MLLSFFGIGACALFQSPDPRTEAVRLYQYQDLRDELLVENPKLSAVTAKPGDKLTREVTFALLSPQKEKKFHVTETVALAGQALLIELSKQEGEKTQGSHVSTIQITVPKDVPPGTYTIITRIGTEEYQVTKRTEFQVLK
ncbi:MAG TPA: hypothetical protein VGJ94_04055 [Syntrophorhabdaceae bacterium]